MNEELVIELIDGALREISRESIPFPVVIAFVSATGTVLVLRANDPETPDVMLARGLDWTFPVSVTITALDGGGVRALMLETSPEPALPVAEA